MNHDKQQLIRSSRDLNVSLFFVHDRYFGLGKQRMFTWKFQLTIKCNTKSLTASISSKSNWINSAQRFKIRSWLNRQIQCWFLMASVLECIKSICGWMINYMNTINTNSLRFSSQRFRKRHILQESWKYAKNVSILSFIQMPGVSALLSKILASFACEVLCWEIIFPKNIW